MKKQFHEIFSDFELKLPNPEEDITLKRMSLKPSIVS